MGKIFKAFPPLNVFPISMNLYCIDKRSLNSNRDPVPKGGGDVTHNFWLYRKEDKGDIILNNLVLTYLRSVLIFIKQEAQRAT